MEIEIEIENIHVCTLALTALCILYADHLGFQYFRGTREKLDAVVTKRLHHLVWAGLLGMIGSGVFLVVPLWEYLAYEPVFYVKMGFVLTLMFNAWIIGQVSHVASTHAFKDLPKAQQTLFLASGALSGMGWVGAAIIGFFFL
jgi:hypothetical protein